MGLEETRAFTGLSDWYLPWPLSSSTYLELILLVCWLTLLSLLCFITVHCSNLEDRCLLRDMRDQIAESCVAEKNRNLSSIFWSVVIPSWSFCSTVRIPRKKKFWWALLVERCLVAVLLSSEASPFIRAAFWGFQHVCGLNQASDLREDVLYFSSWILTGCSAELGDVGVAYVYHSKSFNFFPWSPLSFRRNP